MPFKIVQQDITKMKVDAIVNAANTDLQMGGGVCGAIFKAAGYIELQEACDKFSPIETGEAVITPGFNLLAKFVIHTAGPIYNQWSKEESEQHLRNAYINSLKIAVENNCKSIAFPLISSGIYGYPKDEALQVASSAIQDFLLDHDLDVSLVIFDKESFSISRKLLGEVKNYIDKHFIEKQKIKRKPKIARERSVLYKNKSILDGLTKGILGKAAIPPVRASIPVDDLVRNLDEPFSQLLLHLIKTKEMTEVEVYKRANLDRKLFSKIRSNKNYMPSKRTAVALAIALKLTIDETKKLLERAGFALSHAVKFDVIIEYFIINEKYNVFEINEVLFEYDQPLLGY